MEMYYKQPKYYDQFRCIGSDCIVTCCAHWEIDWMEHEVLRLKEADCGDELENMINTCFTEALYNMEKHRDKENKYSIALKEDGECPFHGFDGLCMIQKKLGEEYLSEVCQVYPRRFFIHYNTVIRSCNTSCPAVLDLLSDDINAVRLENKKAEKNFKARLSSKGDSAEEIRKHPVLNYRLQLMEFYNKIITCRSISLETAIVIGALASKRLTDVVQNGNYNEIPGIISEYEKKLHDKATIAAIEEIKANPIVQFKFVNNFLLTYFSKTNIRIDISNLHDGTNLLPERYQEGNRAINEAFKDREYFFRNVAANMLIEQNAPFYIKDATILENYSYFALTTAAIKLLSVSVAQQSRNVEKNVKRAIAILSRNIAHNSDNAKTVINDMKDHGFNSAAHIALIVK